MAETRTPKSKDWVGNRRNFWIAWGLPTAALLAAIFVAPPIKTLIWALALVWMGAACLANARRCSRTHCYFTGPFFFLMAVLTVLHGFEIVWLGPNGWTWLGVTIFLGTGALWIVTERLLGKFSRPPETPT